MYFFAYDEFLNRKTMAALCPGAKPHASAALPNHRLIFSGWQRRWHGGTAAIMASAGDRVRGGVYEVTEADQRKLDRAMGYPAMRQRIPVTVFDQDDKPFSAFTYAPKGRVEPAAPGAEYLALLQQGIRDWGLR
jgi:gamma-glutamylcyclotransferase